MRRLYKYLMTISLCLPTSCGTNGSDGPAGAPGAPGSSGSDGQKGGSSLVAVYDAKGNKFGWLLPDSSATSYLPVLSTSGHVLEVEFVSGSARLSRKHSSRAVGRIFYTSTDCLSSGRVPESLSDMTTEIFVSMRATDYDFLEVRGSVDPVGEYAYKAFEELNQGTGKVTCTVQSGTLEKAYFTRLYPGLFVGPFSLRAE